MRSRHPGFSLLELSVVLVVLSLMLGGILSVMTQESRRSKTEEANKRLDEIQRAFITFRKSNNRLPCPAIIATAPTVSTFGYEAATPGTCTGTLFNSSVTVGGAVPVRTLGLPDHYMFDPWGGRFRYSVDMRFTATDAFETFSIRDHTAPLALPVITNEGLVRYTAVNNRVSAAATNVLWVMALVSHGPNGHGAYQLNGALKMTGSTNTSEWQNCDCNATVATAFDRVVVMTNSFAASSDQLTGFDDIVRYFTRSQLMSEEEMETNTP